jgi:hypothetical protein
MNASGIRQEPANIIFLKAGSHSFEPRGDIRNKAAFGTLAWSMALDAIQFAQQNLTGTLPISPRGEPFERGYDWNRADMLSRRDQRKRGSKSTSARPFPN